MALRLLVTRPQPQADAWVARLRAHRIDAHALPLLTIGAVVDPAALRAAWCELSCYALVMFVSPNAVSHFFAARPGAAAGCAWPAGTRAAVTGPGSLSSLHAAGVPPAQCVAPPPDAAQFDTNALWEQLRGETWTDRRALVLRGDGGRDEFAQHLRRAGASVQFLQAYRRGPATLGTAERRLLDSALAQPLRHVWWLSSAEAVGYLPQLAPGAHWGASCALASHPRIAARARDIGFGRVFDAPPTLDAVLAAIDSISGCLQSAAP